MDQLDFVRFREHVRLAMSAELDELARLGAEVEQVQVHLGLLPPPTQRPASKDLEWRRREVARLRHEEGLTQPQIAARLNVGLGAVRNDLRARDSVGTQVGRDPSTSPPETCRRFPRSGRGSPSP
jgi:DNA-directed RNA polymerase specialized sigma24 family protein